MLVPRRGAYLLRLLDRAADQQRCPIWIDVRADIIENHRYQNLVFLILALLYFGPEVLYFFMQGQTGERWRKLCEQAAVEQDPQRLLELAKEITKLLDEKEDRLKRLREGSAA